MMHNNDDMLFDAPTKKGGNENDIKISIIELKASEDNSPCPDLERTQIAIKSLNAGIWTLDILTNSLIVCNRCKEIAVVCNEESVNVGRLRDLIAAGYDNKIMETFLLALNTGSPFDVEVPVIAVKNSCPQWLRITGAAACNNKNSARAIHGMVEDISERKNSELLKQDFLAMVSHDLRSPLSVIKLYMQMCDNLAGTIGNSRISGMLKKAALQVHKMNRMIQCYL